MNNDLVNKTVIITGASSGIGERIAAKVAERGGRPVLLARSSEKLAAICQSINEKASVDCRYYPLDVSDFHQVKTVFAKIAQDVGRIDILVNNAGFGLFDSFAESDLEDIKAMFNVNVFGLMACTKEVLPFMLERNSGHIINIASQAGKLATPKSSGYSATKHAVLGFTNSLRLELTQTNIFISAVNPGPIETNFFNLADKTGNYVKNVKKFMLRSDDVAEKIVQLMIKPKRELNLPQWMNAGSVLYNLFPNLAEKLTGKLFNMK
jgi:short-subunit dehydrogenase